MVYPFDFTSGPHDADVLVIGEAWGRSEYEARAPFVGEAGRILDQALGHAGLTRDNVLITNIVDDQPYGNEFSSWFYPTQWANKQADISTYKGLYPNAKVKRGATKLYTLINKVKPKVIVALGNYPLWLMNQNLVKIKNSNKRKVPTGILSQRGSQVYTDTPEIAKPIKLLPSLHPAFVSRAYTWHDAMYYDFNVRLTKAFKNDWTPPQYKFIIDPSFNEVMEILDWIERGADDVQIAHDIETKWNAIVCQAFAWSATDAICIPTLGSDYRHWPIDQEAAIWIKLQRIFTKRRLFGQNYNYDRFYIWLTYGVYSKVDWDTMAAEHLIYPGMPRGLDYLSSRYLPFHRYWKDDGKEWVEGDIRNLWNYNCLDAVNTFDIRWRQRDVLDNEGLLHLMEERLDLMEMAFEMTRDGVKIDQEVRSEQKKKLLVAQEKIAENLNYLVPEEVIPRTKTPFYRSPIQLMDLFYKTLRLKPVLEKGKKTTNDKALEKLQTRYPGITPLFSMLQEYRSLGKFLEFCDMELEPDGMMRTQWNTSKVETFRRASHENPMHRAGNLQNISEGKEE